MISRTIQSETLVMVAASTCSGGGGSNLRGVDERQVVLYRHLARHQHALTQQATQGACSGAGGRAGRHLGPGRRSGPGKILG